MLGGEIVYTKINPNKRDLTGATMYSEYNMYMEYEIYAWNADNETSDEMIHISCDVDSRSEEGIEIRRADGEIEISIYGFNKKRGL